MQRKVAVPTGYEKDQVDGITRYSPLLPELGGIVMFSELGEQSIEDAISAQTEYFARIGRQFEWKVYAFDTPADLAQRLEARGFLRGESEAFMIYEMEGHRSKPGIGDLQIERISTRAGVSVVVAIQERIWGRQFPWLESCLMEAMNQSAIYCAYWRGEPVGAGWMEFPTGADFSELHGGCVLPAMRGRGIYSALFDIRVEEAKRRGIRFLTVDAAPMSRPILAKKGFTYVCETIPFRKNS